MAEEAQVRSLEPRKTLNGGMNASEMGKRGVAKREANILEDLSRARQHMNKQTPAIAERMTKAALGKLDMNPIEFAAGKDILDRTVGKAPTEIHLGMADQSLDIIRELDDP